MGDPTMMRVMGRPAFATRYWNPYPWLLYTHLRSAGVEVDESTRERVMFGRYDILHLHWPEQHLNHPSRIYAWGRTLTLLAQLMWVRLRGTRVVWTVHNLRAHERLFPRFERWFWRVFVGLLDGYICLTEASRELAREQNPGLRDVPGVVIPHGDYREVYANDVTPFAARERLSIDPDSRVVLFIGAIREYKNVPALIDAFRESSDPAALLVIAGRPSDDRIANEIARHAGGDPRVRLAMTFIADDDLQLYFNAADVVVLPYREILNSGSAILSLSFNRPVVLPQSACGEELRSLVGPQWVMTYEGEIGGRHLSEALDWTKTAARPPVAELSELSWDRIAAMTARFYRSICEEGKG